MKLGQVAYDAHFKDVGGKTPEGHHLVDFSGLSNTQKEHWEIIAQAVRTKVSEEVREELTVEHDKLVVGQATVHGQPIKLVGEKPVEPPVVEKTDGSAFA